MSKRHSLEQGSQPIPDIYQVVSCIKAGSSNVRRSKWIDTGFVPNEKTLLRFDGQILKSMDNNFSCRAFGCENDINHTGQFRFGGSAAGCFLYGYANYPVDRTLTADDSRHVIEIDAGILYIDGVQKVQFTQTPFIGYGSIWIFYTNCPNVKNGFGNIKVWSVKIWDDGMLARDYVPVRRIVDGELGLYCRVTGRFDINQGTEAFAYEL